MRASQGRRKDGRAEEHFNARGTRACGIVRLASVAAAAVLVASTACSTPPAPARIDLFGFRSLDFSAEFWTTLPEESKLHGKVSDVVDFDDIERITILRCRMGVPGGDWFERMLRSSIPAEGQFSLDPVPDRIANARTPTPGYLVLLFETQQGQLGMLTRYDGMTIIEVDRRIGIILLE